jgi:cytochrome b subunit of formate dehydrogenase
VFVERTEWTMLLIDDFKHVFQDDVLPGPQETSSPLVGLQLRRKMEYLAVVWGTVVMAITGFMMWNPIATTLSARRSGSCPCCPWGEAVLVVAIILWHLQRTSAI